MIKCPNCERETLTPGYVGMLPVWKCTNCCREYPHTKERGYKLEAIIAYENHLEGIDLPDVEWREL